MTSPSDRRADLIWRLSSFTGQENCVEVGDAGDSIAVRNSNRRAHGSLWVSRRVFAALVADVKSGGLDHLC